MSAPAGDLRRPTVVVAGATGFIGRALLPLLVEDHTVIALGRGGAPAGADGRVQWRRCDLFNLREAEAALQGASIAVYLVHSMQPQARLTQARFDDLDLLCADNFARAAARQGIRHIVYLGGLLPADRRHLSRHLASRLEVEETLASHGVPVTTLRAGLVIGAGGSSFEMMERLVRRLPVMVAPRWSRTVSQPIALTDVTALLTFAIAHPDLAGRAYDIGGPDVVTYADMLRATGRMLGKRVWVLTLPVRTANLSLLWVSAITGASQALVRPLVESLGHDMVVTDGGALQGIAGQRPLSLTAALTAAQSGPTGGSAQAPRPQRSPAPARTVCSVQRLPVGSRIEASAVAEAYLRWLPRFLGPLFFVRVEGGDCRFFFRLFTKPILALTLDGEGSSVDRQMFRVTGGLLADLDAGPQARLEFRLGLGGSVVLAAIHDFVPRLPWMIYRLTQGPFHVAVMHAFGRHLAAITSRLPGPG